MREYSNSSQHPGSFMNRKQKKKIRELFIRLLRVMARKRVYKGPFEGTVRTAVILASERYGDCILLTPLLVMLRKKYPGIELHLIVFKQSIYDFFCHDASLSGIHFVKGNYFRYVREVFFRKYDLLFNPKDAPSFNFILQSILIRARFKVAHHAAFHTDLYDYLICRDYATHITERNCLLLEALGSVPASISCNKPYIPSMPVSKIVREFVSQLSGGSISAINISASVTAKYWPAEKWSALLEAFPEQRFIVFSAPKARDLLVKRQLEAMHNNVLTSPLTANLFEVGELVRIVRVLVSLDTSLIHVASCSNTPVAGLYRNRRDDIIRFSPLSDRREIIVSSGEDVSDISVEAVVEAVGRLYRH